MDQWAEQVLKAPSNEYLPHEIASRPQSRGSNDSTLIGALTAKSRSRATTVNQQQESGDTFQQTRSRQQSVLTRVFGVRKRPIIALIAGICQQSLCWGMIMTFGTILSFYTKHLIPHRSKTSLCIIGALPPFFVLGLSLLWGRLLDAGHHRKINALAMVCLTGGLVGLMFTGSDGHYSDGRYWQILIASLPIGVGQSVYFLAAPHMAKSWYPERKGLAMGITNSGAAIGGSIWPIIFTKLTAKYSFQVGIGTLAVISGILGILITWAAKPAPCFKPRPIENPGKWSTWVPVRAFRSKTFLVHIAAMCWIYLGILAVPFFLEYWAQRNGVGVSEAIKEGKGVDDDPPHLTVFLVVIMNACQLPGRLGGSALCDRFRARKIHCIACLVAVILISTCWMTITQYITGCVFAALFGLTLGIMVSLPINDAQEILGAHRTHLLGQYAGIVYSIASPFIFGGAVLGGLLVDKFHNFAAGIWASSTLGVGCILILCNLFMKDDTWKFDDCDAPDFTQYQKSSNEGVEQAHATRHGSDKVGV